MILSRLKLTAFVGTLVAALGLLGSATAGPPPGSRWSDHAFGSSSSRSTPSYSAPVTGGMVLAPSASSGTIAVRGPDGVVRNYPIAGGAVVRQQTGSPNLASQTVLVRGADGVLRSYPVVGGPAVSGPAIVEQRGVFRFWRCR